MFDPKKARLDFPFFANNKNTVCFDNAATTQKPNIALQAEFDFYTHTNANIHRGAYKLSQKATDLFEEARVGVAKFINASPEEIIFTGGATDSLNVVACSFCRAKQLPPNPGNLSIIYTTEMEHASNIVPFQNRQAVSNGFDQLGNFAINKNAQLDFEEIRYNIEQNHAYIKLITITHVSNAIGCINDVKSITAIAHSYGIPVCIDGAQAIAHLPVDVKDIDCDFYAFSGHKVYGPTGIGVLYAKTQWQKIMHPWKFGGGAIETVDLNKHNENDPDVMYAPPPYKFEAGTPHIAGAIGLDAALHYLKNLNNFTEIVQYEHALHQYAVRELTKIPNLNIIGRPEISIISFIMPKIDNQKLAKKLDKADIQVRAGYHCAHSLFRKLNLLNGSVRVSFAMYNTREEIDYLCQVLKKIQ